MSHGHHHPPVGDPELAAALHSVVSRLEADCSDQAAQQLARELLARARDDANPRTRAQARSLGLILSLLERGDEATAQDLLTNELHRSFLGQGHV